MRRTVPLLVLVGLTATGVPAIALAETAPAGVTPVQGGGGCEPTPIHVIAAGREPRAPLRLELTGVAHHSKTVHEVETFVRRTRLLDGRWHPATAIRKILIVLRGGAIAGGTVAISARNTTSFPATKTTAGGTGGTFTLTGHTDAKSGGFLGGSAGNDRFPDDALGVGASWSVVLCDSVDDDAPAKETRTYTLRSLAHGIAVLSYREVVSMDPAHRDLGSQTIGNEKARVRLDRLRGTTTGTVRVPLAQALATKSTQVTRVEITYHVIAKNVPATPIIIRLVDTRKDTPTG